ncbi:MAG: YCF48-related protein [Gammaproteobacteria bacterium]
MTIRRTIRGIPHPLTAFALALACALPAHGAEEDLKDHRAPIVIDFLDGEYMPAMDGILVTGLHGLLGLLKFTGDGAEFTRFKDIPNADFTALERWSDGEALLGSSDAKIYVFDGQKLTETATLSEYHEPVLDIAAANGTAWAGGGRGMLSTSKDGRTWTTVEIGEATQPQLTFPGTEAGDWYFGVGNMNLDSVVFTANVGGKPAVADTDYTLYPDEGFIQFIKALDAEPAPTIGFKFAPGPAFRAGDVSWNAVLFDGNSLTLAGEFGMVLQSQDGGQTWVRRDARMTQREPEPPYWMAGTQKDQSIYLVGAAGAMRASHDGGVTWSQLPAPGNEGVFGVTVTADGKPVVTGAVGLIGSLDGETWSVADRSELQLLSWLRTLVEMPDGTLIALGGRSTVIAFKDGKWSRVPVTVKE